MRAAFKPFLLPALAAGAAVFFSAGFMAAQYARAGRDRGDAHKIISGCSNAWDALENYLRLRPHQRAPGEVRGQVAELLSDPSLKGHYGVYFERLDSGCWFGVNETDLFNQWSLLKVEIAMTVLKKIERGELELGRRVALSAAEINAAAPVGGLSYSGEFTIKQLIERMICDSDNASAMALARFFSADEFQDTLLAVGMPSAPAGQPRNFLPPASPKEYANSLRDLYFAKYLSKPSSDLLLALKANTRYDSQIRKGLPANILVSHKVGFNADSGDFHDCGIVFLPGRAYILCVMSSGNTREEADRVIGAISRLVYEFVSAEGCRAANKKRPAIAR